MKLLFLYLIKILGGFWIARKLMRNKVLILAYHGFEVLDEAKFRPKLFIKKATFENRLKYLKQYTNVISLADLSAQNKPDNAIVITIDDGWASTSTIATPLLNHFAFPHTIYLTTESVLAQQPIFHILLDYILRNSLGKKLSLNMAVQKPVESLITLDNIAELMANIEQCKSTKYDTGLLERIAISLDFKVDEIINKRVFTLLSVEEVKDLATLGVDIQLHTHTHHTYLDDEVAFSNEITVNQMHIEKIIGKKPLHHCYPSGSYNKNSSKWLETLGIKTATTCIPGFCDNQTNSLELPRFLDGENIPQIVFEAEVCGVLELLRKFKRLLSN